MTNLVDKHLMENMGGVTPRRGFFTRMAGALTLGFAGLSAPAVDAQTTGAAPGGPDWPGALKGRYKQVVDAYEVNSGFPLAFVYTFIATNDPTNSTAVLVLRHGAFPLSLNDAMWEKYKIGETLNINDPETKAAAKKNPYYKPKPGVLQIDDIALDRLIDKGTVVGACNFALRFFAKKLSANAGMTAEETAKEFAANLVSGVAVIPSGTWGVNRAQDAGCSYCAGG